MHVSSTNHAAREADVESEQQSTTVRRELHLEDAFAIDLSFGDADRSVRLPLELAGDVLLFALTHMRGREYHELLDSVASSVRRQNCNPAEPPDPYELAWKLGVSAFMTSSEQIPSGQHHHWNDPAELHLQLNGDACEGFNRHYIVYACGVAAMVQFGVDPMKAASKDLFGIAEDIGARLVVPTKIMESVFPRGSDFVVDGDAFDRAFQSILGMTRSSSDAVGSAMFSYLEQRFGHHCWDGRPAPRSISEATKVTHG